MRSAVLNRPLVDIGMEVTIGVMRAFCIFTLQLELPFSLFELQFVLPLALSKDWSWSAMRGPSLARNSLAAFCLTG